MADVRALLAAEKSSRRISHPYATYKKSGTLTCSACDLAIRSESLWEGHLKSTNHRKNAARIAAGQINQEYSIASTVTRNLKRKIEDVDEHEAQIEEKVYEVDGSKKPKSRAVSAAETQGSVPSLPSHASGSATSTSQNVASQNGKTTDTKHVRFSTTIDTDEHGPVTKEERQGIAETEKSTNSSATSASAGTSMEADANTMANIDEDEWAAFESEIATVESQSRNEATSAATTSVPPIQSSSSSSAVITAAPISASQIRTQEAETAATQRKILRDTEIEDEKEDETRRIEEEFEIMEEMEEKVRRLKEKRESLRLPLSLPFSFPASTTDSGSGFSNDRGLETGGAITHTTDDSEAFADSEAREQIAREEDEDDAAERLMQKSRTEDENEQNSKDDKDGKDASDDDSDDDDIDDWYS